ncbi:MAG: FAD:protein FMN transferase [Candidatus Moraniibacteriota bacterium]
MESWIVLKNKMEENIFEKEFRALGTEVYIGIVASGDESEKVLLNFNKIENICREKELILSRFDLKSELSKLNNNLGIFHEVSEDILFLAQKSLDYYLKSERIFDPRILEGLEKIGYKINFQNNTFDAKDDFSKEIFAKDLREELIIEGNRVKFYRKMDFAGVAKGYVVDEIAKELHLAGWKDFLIDLGGDMYASGLNKRGEKWGIALEESEDENEVMIEISNEGIATSGNTRKHWEIDGKKFHHLINPQDVDMFSFELKSVTVVADTTEEADVMAKVLFLMGLERGLDFANKHKIRNVFLKNSKEIIKSRALS